MMFKVLFIDDDSFMLNALQRMAKRLRPHWQFWTENDATCWKQVLTEPITFDLVVCDYLMPLINGDEVLAEVSQVQPSAIRALLTGDVSEKIVCSVGRVAHFILSKPFSDAEIERLFSCIERIHALPYSATVRSMLVSSASLLPQPDVVKQVRLIIQNDNYRISDIVALISHDPLLVARILQLSNSAFMGFSKSTLSVEEAVKRLGIRLTCDILAAIAVEQAISGLLDEAEHVRINEHAYDVALYTKRLCELLNLNKGVQEVLFTTALLSAIGELVVATRIWQDRNAKTFAAWSTDKLSVAVSTYFLTSWGYSELVCQTLLWSAEPDWLYSKQNLSLLLFLAKRAAEHNGEIPPAVLHNLPEAEFRQKLQQL
jgi:HD-like signal output (HDOD) protein